MSLTRMSKRSSSMARRACSALVATRNGYDSISRIELMSLQMDRSSSTTRILGFVTIPSHSDPRLRWYRQCKHRSLAHRAFYYYITAMARRYFFYERKTQPETALLTSLFVSASIELFEDLRRLVGGNTKTFVRHMKSNGRIAVGHTNAHRRVLRA